jgi:hypothetical protein
MMLSKLHQDLSSAPSGAYEFVAYLATVDMRPNDDVDVQLVEIGNVIVDDEKKEIRLIPASSTADKPDAGTFALLGSVLDACPLNADGEYDMRLLIELPLLREDPKFDRPEMAEMAGVYLGPESQEAWFLVYPAQEFPVGSLPV